MVKELVHITDYKALDNYIIWLRYADGVEGVVDLSEYLQYPIFEKWKNKDFFKAMKVEDGRNVFWNEDLDLCPDALYIKITGVNPYA